MTSFEDTALDLYQTFAAAIDAADEAFGHARDEAEREYAAEAERIGGVQRQATDKVAKDAADAFDRVYRLNVYSDDRSALVKARTDGERLVALTALADKTSVQLRGLVEELDHLLEAGPAEVGETVFGPPLAAVPVEQAVRDALQGIKDGAPLLVHVEGQECSVAVGDTSGSKDALVALARRTARVRRSEAHLAGLATAAERRDADLAAAQEQREAGIAVARLAYETKLAALRQALDAVVPAARTTV